MENVTESRRNHYEIDGFPTDFSSEFCQGDIPSQFRCDSDSTDFPWIQRIFDGTRVLFLHVPSLLGPNWLFHLGCLGKMLGCLKCIYENCIFICQCLLYSYSGFQKYSWYMESWARVYLYSWVLLITRVWTLGCVGKISPGQLYSRQFSPLFFPAIFSK